MLMSFPKTQSTWFIYLLEHSITMLINDYILQFRKWTPPPTTLAASKTTRLMWKATGMRTRLPSKVI